MKRVNYIISTFFYCGYFPFAPGTFASLIASIVAYNVLMFYGLKGIFFFFLISTISGFMSAGRVAEIEGERDPSIIVVDEVSGILTSILIAGFYIKNSFFNVLFSFVFFRFFDILKPYPVKRFERINGSGGIMLDDIVAGILAGMVIVAWKLLSGYLG